MVVSPHFIARTSGPSPAVTAVMVSQPSKNGAKTMAKIGFANRKSKRTLAMGIFPHSTSQEHSERNLGATGSRGTLLGRP